MKQTSATWSCNDPHYAGKLHAVLGQGQYAYPFLHYAQQYAFRSTISVLLRLSSVGTIFGGHSDGYDTCDPYLYNLLSEDGCYGITRFVLPPRLSCVSLARAVHLALYMRLRVPLLRSSVRFQLQRSIVTAEKRLI